MTLIMNKSTGNIHLYYGRETYTWCGYDLWSEATIYEGPIQTITCKQCRKRLGI